MKLLMAALALLCVSGCDISAPVQAQLRDYTRQVEAERWELAELYKEENRLNKEIAEMKVKKIVCEQL